MNQNVAPLTVFLVLLGLDAFLAAVFHFNKQALEVDRPSLMAPLPTAVPW